MIPNLPISPFFSLTKHPFIGFLPTLWNRQIKLYLDLNCMYENCIIINYDNLIDKQHPYLYNKLNKYVSILSQNDFDMITNERSKKHGKGVVNSFEEANIKRTQVRKNKLISFIVKKFICHDSINRIIKQ